MPELVSTSQQELNTLHQTIVIEGAGHTRASIRHRAVHFALGSDHEASCHIDHHGGVAWPKELSPQHSAAPSARTAHESFSPALTATKLPSGGVDWPSVTMNSRT
jgi:hypothetical protein